MPHYSIIETLYLGGVVAAFSLFAVVLGAVSTWQNLVPAKAK